MNINADLLQWSIHFFDEKPSSSGIKKENMSNQELTEELHKPMIRKLKMRKVHSPL